MAENARVIHNEKCLECNSCEEDMVKIGPIVVCHRCFMSLFVANDLYREKGNIICTTTDVYKRLMIKRKLFLGKEEDVVAKDVEEKATEST